MHKLRVWLDPRHTEAGVTPRRLVIGAVAVPISIKALLLLVVFLLGAVAGFGGRTAYDYAAHMRGGLRAPSQHMHTIRASGGLLPTCYSLERYVVRVHWQASSNSCVGQTVSAMDEIAERERGQARSFSPGYIWNQSNGCSDSPITYQQAFNTLTAQGDAPLSAFPEDGTWGLCDQPNGTARAAAWPYHFKSWAAISLSDRYTISYEIAHGRPVALATPWYYSDVNYAGGIIYGHDSGFAFWHSTLAVGYCSYGLLVLNSFGANWGEHGYYQIAWSALGVADPNGEVGIAAIAVPSAGFPKKPKPFNAKRWNQYAVKHHRRPQPYRDPKTHRITWLASTWSAHDTQLGGLISEHFYPQPKSAGYEEANFQGGVIVWWPHIARWGVKITRHGWRA